ncbi:hypothetical protein V8B97DRAFT_2023395 [Scleroderma yunnanense]
MARQKSSLNKKPLIPESPSKKKTPTSENSSLEAIHHIKETWKAYDGHICWGHEWLQSHTKSSSTIPTSIVNDIYNDPAFKDAFEKLPNHCSDKALALYLTVEGVHVAFKKLWDSITHITNLAKSDRNPATSTEVDDVMASIKHKVTAEGSDHVHSSAMKKEYMDKILTWCFKLVKLKQEDVQIIDVTLQGTLITNKRDTYYEIHLRNWKGWQKKLTAHAIIPDAAAGNHYKIYLWPDLTSLEHVHLGWAMVNSDFIFPAIRANSILKPCGPISQDAVQKWISEATTGARIEGGAQYWFMYAPVGQQWPLSTVQWWGRWADGKHHDTLICYLLDELHSYKNDHGDTLGPFPHEADMSLAGKHALAAPATREELMKICNLDNNIQAILRNCIHDRTCCPSSQSTDLQHLFICSIAISPSLVTAESDTLTYSSPSPFIPDVPFTHADGTTTPRNQAWKDIIQHCEEGVPQKKLLPLKDWPYKYTHGPNHNLQSKYNQQHVIMLKFLDWYKGDEKKFIEAYESNIQKGITSLLHAITAAHQQQGEVEIQPCHQPSTQT